MNALPAFMLHEMGAQLVVHLEVVALFEQVDVVLREHCGPVDDFVLHDRFAPRFGRCSLKVYQSMTRIRAGIQPGGNHAARR